MLKDGLVLIAICVALVGGTFWWSAQSPPRRLNAPSEQVQKPEATAIPVTANPAVKPRRAAASVVEEAAVLEPIPVPAAPEPVPAIPPPPPPPFPAVDQIATGAHEDSITGKYGDPALSAVTSAGGHKVETLIYAKDRGRSATVIRLEDGRVSSAYSPSEPVPPTGLSAPRRSRNP